MDEWECTFYSLHLHHATHGKWKCCRRMNETYQSRSMCSFDAWHWMVDTIEAKLSDAILYYWCQKWQMLTIMHYALCSLVGHVRRILNEKWIMECCRSIIVLHQLLANENVTHIHSHTYTHIYSTYTHNRSVVFRHDACLPLSEQ